MRKRTTLEALQLEIGRRIAELRVARGWTQGDLADRMGIVFRHVQSIEAGEQNMQLGSIVAVADALGVDVRALFEAPATLARPRRGRPPKVRPPGR